MKATEEAHLVAGSASSLRGAQRRLSAYTFTAIFVPAGVPAPIVARLNAVLRKAMSVESVRDRYRGMGMDIMDRGQAEFAAYVRADYDK